MPKEKTDAQWNQIRFQNSLGPQIGGLLHDAVALQVAFINKINDKDWIDNRKKIKKMTENNIKNWLDVLYEISEQKKAELTEPKPINIEKAVKQGDKWKKETLQEEKERDAQETAIIDEGREREARDKLNLQ